MAMLRRNVLIFHAGALGDFVLTWPLAMALARVFAQSRIIYVTHARKGKLAERVLRVESTDAEQGWHGLHGPGLAESNRRMLAGAHTIVHFIANADPAWEANVRAMNPDATIIPLYPRPSDPGAAAEHVVQFVIGQLRPHLALHAAAEQLLRSVEQRGIPLARASASPRSRRVVMHPGSGSAMKCWPRQRFVELARHLRQDGKTVTTVLGEVELERWSAAQIDPFAAVGGVVCPADHLELLDAVGSAEVFIGNDSGPSHLAGILGVPTVAIFGATDPKVWKPLGPHVHVVKGGSLDAISVEQVLAAAASASG